VEEVLVKPHVLCKGMSHIDEMLQAQHELLQQVKQPQGGVDDADEPTDVDGVSGPTEIAYKGQFLSDGQFGDKAAAEESSGEDLVSGDFSEKEEGDTDEESLKDYPNWLLDQLKLGQLEMQQRMAKSLAKVNPSWQALSAENKELENLLNDSKTPVAGEVIPDLWYLFCQLMDCSKNNGTRTCGLVVDHSQWACNKCLQKTRSRQACDGLDAAILDRLWELHELQVDLTTLDFSKDEELQKMDTIRAKTLLNMTKYKDLKAKSSEGAKASTSKAGPSTSQPSTKGKASTSKQTTARMSASTSKPSSSKKAAAINKPGLSKEPESKKSKN
jgi:hypothetical protein